MKEVAAKMQGKGGLKTCHVSITMVNNVCDCGKIIEHLHHHTDIEIDSELETDNVMEDLFTYVNRLYEETKLKKIKN